MPEAPQTGERKRWLGYTCPDCRMIFRIEAGSQGKRAQCPGCHALMVLGGGAAQQAAPRDTEPRKLYSPAVINEAPAEEAATYLAEDAVSGRRVALLGPSLADQVDDLAWERSSAKTEIGNTALTAMLLVMLVFVGGIGYLVYGIVRDDLRAGKRETGGDRSEVVSAEGALLIGSEPETVVLNVADAGQVAEIKQVVVDFLAAPTVDEMLGYVRHRDRLEPVIREYYQSGYRPVVARDIAPEGKVQVVNSQYSVVVELRDYSQKPIAVEKVDGAYLVDWESWVGYSEMPWADFLKTRPRGAKMFRVRVSPVNYYNFDFIDDKKWQSFRLESPDEEFLIFGYAERFSEVAQDLSFPKEAGKESAAIVTLRWPDNPRTRNQVIISAFLGSGWVAEDNPEGTP